MHHLFGVVISTNKKFNKMNTLIFLFIIGILWITLMVYSAAALPQDRAERMMKMLKIILMIIAFLVSQL